MDQLKAECASVCKKEASCQTLPSQLKGSCMEICLNSSLKTDVRKCMAQAQGCKAFNLCANKGIADNDPPSLGAGNSAVGGACAGEVVECDGAPGGSCSYPLVCCLLTFDEGGGNSFTENACTQWYCPWWSLDQAAGCGCLHTSEAYPGCHACESVISCEQTDGTSCGWCISNNQAVGPLYGSKSGPSGGVTCPTWIWEHSDCPKDQTGWLCNAITDCGQIENTSCGWCINNGSGQGIFGTKDGPYNGTSCESWIWSHSDCP